MRPAKGFLCNYFAVQLLPLLVLLLSLPNTVARSSHEQTSCTQTYQSLLVGARSGVRKRAGRTIRGGGWRTDSLWHVVGVQLLKLSWEVTWAALLVGRTVLAMSGALGKAQGNSGSDGSG